MKSIIRTIVVAIVLLYGFNILNTCSFNCLAQDTWTQKTDFGGTARFGAVGFSIGTKGYIGTGLDGTAYTKDFWEYDPTANTWTQKADFGGTARYQAVGFSIGTKGYIGTGVVVGVNYKDFWEYDPTANTWTQKADFGGTARYLAVGFSIGTKGYIGTGYSNIRTKDFWEYDPTSDTWTQKTDFGGTARRGAVGFSIGSKGYIGTGRTNATYTKDFWEYDPTANTWTQKTDFGGAGRHLAASFSIGSKGYIGTGSVPANSKDFWEYDPTANTWTQKTDFGGAARVAAVGFSIGCKGYIGTGSDGVYKKDFWEYTPSSCVSLPIELLSFNATAVKDNNGKQYVSCEWSTATETNNDYFSIQRSKDGVAFEQIGTVQGAGNSSQVLNYVFYDEHPYTDFSYYRLKQTDYDGKYTYSKIKTVYIGAFEIIALYPSIASEYIEYKVVSEASGTIKVIVIDMLGREVLNKEEEIEQGTTQKRLDINSLNSGTYLLQLTTEKQEIRQKQFVIK